MTTATVTQRMACDPATRITRSLLGYGVLAGPFYVTVALAQALTRDGFDLRRHSWSLLSNGGLGWIQVTNFLLTGAMVLACAVGLRRALRGGPAGRWAPRLVGAFGVAMLAAGVLRADPALGFPPGTPDGPGSVSWHGAGHLVAGSVGFLCVIVATFVLARRFAASGRRGFAAYSRISGIVFLVGFAGIASGNTAPALTLFFAAAVVVIFTWLAVTAAHLYRTLPQH
jgi:Protein of unknown function (DUF998)